MHRSVVLVVAAALAAACASFNKQCFGDGVCRVEKGGVVSWEGPPDKVAQRRGLEEAQTQAAAENDQAWATAPKRSDSEPIRLLVVGPTTGDPDLEPFMGVYRRMLEEALQGDPRIQLVPHQSAKFLVEASSGDRLGRDRKEVRSAVDEALTRRLRNGSTEVDVVLVAHLAAKKKSGLVAGGGGLGVAEVNNVQFEASLSSVYEFREFRGSQVGRSTDSLALAGVGKDGKKGSANLEQRRDPEKDRAAVQSYAAWVKATISRDIAPGLPSIAAASELRARNRTAAGAELSEAMRKLLGR